MEFGWFVGPKFSLCNGLGQSFGGLGWVEEIRPADNSDAPSCINVTSTTTTTTTTVTVTIVAAQ